MRSINVYCIFDELSEIVITTFVASNDKVARRSFKGWIEKNALDSVDVTLLRLASCSAPDTPADVSQMIADKVVVPVSLGDLE